MEYLNKTNILPNGIKLLIAPHWHRYFGDYYNLKLVITCIIPVTAGLCSEIEGLAEVLLELGGGVVFKRVSEKTGIPSAEKEKVLNKLLEDFENNSLPYLESPSFPKKMILAEIIKTRSAFRKMSIRQIP